MLFAASSSSSSTKAPVAPPPEESAGDIAKLHEGVAAGTLQPPVVAAPPIPTGKAAAPSTAAVPTLPLQAVFDPQCYAFRCPLAHVSDERRLASVRARGLLSPIADAKIEMAVEANRTARVKSTARVRAFIARARAIAAAAEEAEEEERAQRHAAITRALRHGKRVAGGAAPIPRSLFSPSPLPTPVPSPPGPELHDPALSCDAPSASALLRGTPRTSLRNDSSPRASVTSRSSTTTARTDGYTALNDDLEDGASDRYPTIAGAPPAGGPKGDGSIAELWTLEDYIWHGLVMCVARPSLALFDAFKGMRLMLYYYAVGIVAYHYLEGWTPIETAYFLTVTGTTVGYGDYVPSTHVSRLFTSFYMLVGMQVVLASIAPLLDVLQRGTWRERLVDAMCPGASRVDTSDMSLTMAEVNARINYTRRYAVALASPALVLGIGVTLHYYLLRIVVDEGDDSQADALLPVAQGVMPPAAGHEMINSNMTSSNMTSRAAQYAMASLAELPPSPPPPPPSFESTLQAIFAPMPADTDTTDAIYARLSLTMTWLGAWVCDTVSQVDWWALVDGLYFSVVTMTTVGYGDITPDTLIGQLAVSAYVPLAVIALADCLSDIGMINVRKAIRETDYAKVSDECLLRDAVRSVRPQSDTPPQIDPQLNEAEFLIDTLVSFGLVDTDAVRAITRHFRSLTGRGTPRGDVHGEAQPLTTKQVYEELRERVRLGLPLSDGAAAMDVDAGGDFRWASYEEWRERSWVPRVVAKADGIRGQGGGPPTQPKAKTLKRAESRMGKSARSLKGSTAASAPATSAADSAAAAAVEAGADKAAAASVQSRKRHVAGVLVGRRAC